MIDLISGRLRDTRPLLDPDELASYPGALNIPIDFLPVPPAELRPAAVLVPIVDEQEGMSVLLTQRTNQLRNHGGQISFPGGGVESHDVDITATALRETHEEIGIPPEQVEVIGYLDPHLTVSGFWVTPVVGLVRSPYQLLPDEREVADVFDVPLSFVMDPKNHLRRTGNFRGQEVAYYSIPYQGRNIWGATAAMIINLYQKVFF
ncbi:MAG: CoA pyrophosphatase [Pseudomonadota bacterium]|nr:CoA pyrophosphatase [Pseudomonadota bacterium]